MFKLTQISGEELRDFAKANHPEANFLQSPEWGNVQRLRGAKVFHLGVAKDENELVGATLAILRDTRRGRYLEIPGGPLINWDDRKLADFTVNQLRDFAQEQKCIFVRIRPQLEDDPEIRTALKSAGLKPAPFHLNAEHTNILDLTQGEDTILSNMRRQTRYEIRQSIKQEIKVDFATDEKAFKQFYQIQQKTAVRQNFLAPSEKELLAIHEAFGDQARIYRAYVGKKPLSYGLVLMNGVEADYFEAASEEEARNHPTAYALQWQIIRDAKQLGFRRYNLWGIAANQDPKHRYAHVTTFKNGFGGTKTTYVPAHDLVISPLKYAPVWLFETARRKLRHL